jgi:RimJ/RimL family protein N-acetyltransferase
MNGIFLRDVLDTDLDLFFESQQDYEAQQMAAFISDDPADRAKFDSHWNKIMSNKDIIIKTIVCNDEVAGHIAKFVMDNSPELTYWIGKKYWGMGIATESLTQFLRIVTIRPIFARAAKDNLGSIRVLEKNGFTLIGEETGYANARKSEIKEVIMKLS